MAYRKGMKSSRLYWNCLKKGYMAFCQVCKCYCYFLKHFPTDVFALLFGWSSWCTYYLLPSSLVENIWKWFGERQTFMAKIILHNDERKPWMKLMMASYSKKNDMSNNISQQNILMILIHRRWSQTDNHLFWITHPTR